MNLSPTPLARPASFLFSDPGSFAESTLLKRLPEIARRIIMENDFPEENNQRITRFIAELPDGIVSDLDDPDAPDLDLWRQSLRPYVGLSWRQLSFLVGENTFYRRVLAATGYFQPGVTWQIDPFTYQKTKGLATSRQGIRALAERLQTWLMADYPAAEALSAAIASNLWGNRADLSLWPADAAGTLPISQLHQGTEFLLANDLAEMMKVILNQSDGQRRIDFLIDNAGFELVCDLALADLLLQRGWVDQVQFHLKAHPTFVSDALAFDVNTTIDFLRNDPDQITAGFGQRTAAAFADGKLLLKENYFWNSPHPAWEMPAVLRGTLAGSALVISKGDANYRRLVGDLRWPETTPFAQVLSYFPAPLAALRTSKSEVIVGLQPGQVAALDKREPDWRTNGRWGLVQLKP